MPTALDWVEEARRSLYSGYQDVLNKLNGAVASATGQGQVVLAFDPSGLTAGATISIDLEEMYVWSISTRTLTVQRGYNGTSPASHVDGSLVYIKPKFSHYRVFSAINDQLRHLSSPDVGMFRMRATNLTYNPVALGYDLPGEVTNIYDVRYQELIGTDAPRIKTWDLVRDNPQFTSGQGLIVYGGAYVGKPVTVQWRTTYGLFTALTDDVATVTGLQDTAWDIPALGAALKLVPPRDIRRNFVESQPEPRRAEEVGQGANRAAAAGPATYYQQRVSAEVVRLLSKYPPVKV